MTNTRHFENLDLIEKTISGAWRIWKLSEGSEDSVIAPYFFQFACYVLVTIFIVVTTETLISWSNHSVFSYKTHFMAVNR